VAGPNNRWPCWKAGVVAKFVGRPFCVSNSKIVEIDSIADPDRVQGLAAAGLGDEQRRIGKCAPGAFPSEAGRARSLVDPL